ncbi:hypothetical protein Bhyg_09563 [Pseudolycoriella hygida]|uniref:Uncharacterized protein n=1 Tax=Pseudolycoriella hygida TaxID=35572 RepID=A0A9Q0S4I4_9DIPT|nr:hypothetical protein Bhyg_09563 [Pseudolycoriella hygida]
MLARYVTVLSLFWVTLNAQQYNPQQYYNNYYEDTRNSFNSKGVCTINGEVFYGIDCWCYSNKVGTVFITSLIVLLVIFFFINGCIWACIIHCYKNFCGRRDRDDEIFDVGSLRSSMRRSMRRSGMDTPIS